jgi:CO/xanthine dehydrogenase Mo-binding subunit
MWPLDPGCRASNVVRRGESPATDHQKLAATGMGYGAILVEIGIDAELGEIRVHRVCGAFAAGRILNPLLARSRYIAVSSAASAWRFMSNR